MATRKNISAGPAPSAPPASAIRMGSLAAGGLGVLGFALSIICGLSAGNDVAQILQRTVVVSLCLAAIGGLCGAIAGHMIHEQLQARLDAAAAQRLASSQDSTASPPSGSKDG